MRRPDDRHTDEMRPLRLDRGVAEYAEGSCLVTLGRTRVLCTASVSAGVPAWRKGSGAGWVTAEYAMLPRATHQRNARERKQIGGRTQEIQRLIGRSLRACVDLGALGDWTITVDCDVLQADGGTRTASITGGAVALFDACEWLRRHANGVTSPFRSFVAAISGGIVGGTYCLDLDYAEDSTAEVDMNLVVREGGGIIEVQATGEHGELSPGELSRLVEMMGSAATAIITAQRAAAG